MLKRLIASTALSLALALPTVAGAANSTNIDSKKLLDANIRNVNGDKVGEIDGVILDSAGKTQAVVVEVGGFLGMGERHVALSWNALTVSESGDKVTTQYTKDQLKSMPEYKIDQKRRETAYNDPEYRPAMANSRVADGTGAGTKTAMSGNWAKAAGDLKGSELIGADVVNAKNDEIGSVKDVLFDTTGKIKTLLVDPKGIMNGGTKTVAVDMSKVQILQSGDDLRLTSTMTEEQLRSLPDYKTNMAAGSATTSAGGMMRPTAPKK